MQQLASNIAKELETAEHCAIYLSEMARVWPDAKTREQEIRAFAERRHLRLRYYRDGFVAIFDKAPQSKNGKS
jgi:signal transduction histidine kinase